VQEQSGSMVHLSDTRFGSLPPLFLSLSSHLGVVPFRNGIPSAKVRNAFRSLLPRAFAAFGDTRVQTRELAFSF